MNQQQRVRLPRWIGTEIAAGLRVRADFHADLNPFIARRLRDMATKLDSGKYRLYSASDFFDQ